MTGAGGLSTTASSLDYYDTSTSTDLGTVAPIAAGHYTVTATYTGDANHASSASSPLAFTIAQAASTTTVSDAGGTYNGSAFPATATAVTGAGGLSTTASSLDYYDTSTSTDLGTAAPSAAGDYTVTATYTGDANHTSSASSPLAFTIAQAGSTTTVSDAGGTYNGSAFPATSAVTGAAGLSTTASSLDYYDTSTSTDLGTVAPTAAGNYTVTATFTGDANHTSSVSSPLSFTIAQASLTVTANPEAKVYDGLAGTDPSLTYTYSGQASGIATFTGSLSRAGAGSEADGVYAIGLNTLSAGPNYAITFVGANFFITSEVWVNGSWSSSPPITTLPADAPAGAVLLYGIDAFGDIQSGINAINSGGTVDVLAGTYSVNGTTIAAAASPPTCTSARR